LERGKHCGICSVGRKNILEGRRQSENRGEKNFSTGHASPVHCKKERKTKTLPAGGGKKTAGAEKKKAIFLPKRGEKAFPVLESGMGESIPATKGGATFDRDMNVIQGVV